MNIPWWMWVLGGIAGVSFVLIRAAARYRQSLLDEFIGHLKRLRADVDVVRSDRGSIRRGAWVAVQLPSGVKRKLNLAKLTSALAQARTRTSDDRRPIMEHWVHILLELADVEHIDLSASIARIRPRIVVERMFPPNSFEKMPRRTVGSTGLSVVYVIDSPQSVIFVTNDHLEAANLDEPTVHEHALSNLRTTFSSALVRAALDGNKMVAVKTGDTYDAARILLIPEHLSEGEALAAIIPDRDTLMITAIPQDSGQLRDLARNIAAADPRLFDQPVVVRRNGFDVLA